MLNSLKRCVCQNLSFNEPLVWNLITNPKKVINNKVCRRLYKRKIVGLQVVLILKYEQQICLLI